MAVVLLEGIVILVLVLCGLRKAIMDAIPVNLRRAIGIGIGLFIAFIGLKGSGLVVPVDGTGTLARYRKKSFAWYKDVIATNGESLKRFLK